jgi:hypothetical protein
MAAIPGIYLATRWIQRLDMPTTERFTARDFHTPTITNDSLTSTLITMEEFAFGGIVSVTGGTYQVWTIPVPGAARAAGNTFRLNDENDVEVDLVLVANEYKNLPDEVKGLRNMILVSDAVGPVHLVRKG